MKRLFFFTLCFFFFAVAKGETLVIDPVVVAMLGVQYYNENETYDDIKDNQSKIKTYQLAITATVEKIRALEEKTQKYLSTINSVVQNGKDIVYASTIASDIGKYQSKAYEMATGDPILVAVAIKAEYNLVVKALEVVTEIYNLALQDGEKNMLDNKQRIDIIKNVVKELREMRGMAYMVYRQIKAAKRDGILKSLFPEQFRYVVNSKQIADRILKDAKWIRKGGKY